ncbi:winged helix-turn-helix transcriptional regulator [Nocardia fluminea]
MGHSDSQLGPRVGNQTVTDTVWDDELVPDDRGRTSAPEPDCPVEVTLTAISGRWTTLVLRELMGGPLSFGELRDRLPSLSAKVLTDRLRDLEARGLIARRTHPGFPVRTSYALTDLGRVLRPLLIELYRTGNTLAALRRSWSTESGAAISETGS